MHILSPVHIVDVVQQSDPVHFGAGATGGRLGGGEGIAGRAGVGGAMAGFCAGGCCAGAFSGIGIVDMLFSAAAHGGTAACDVPPLHMMFGVSVQRFATICALQAESSSTVSLEHV